jgi:hypothetical protein
MRKPTRRASAKTSRGASSFIKQADANEHEIDDAEDILSKPKCD